MRKTSIIEMLQNSINKELNKVKTLQVRITYDNALMQQVKKSKRKEWTGCNNNGDINEYLTIEMIFNDINHLKDNTQGVDYIDQNGDTYEIKLLAKSSPHTYKAVADYVLITILQNELKKLNLSYGVYKIHKNDIKHLEGKRFNWTMLEPLIKSKKLTLIYKW